MKQLKNSEIELKFSADHLSFEKFDELTDKLNYRSLITHIVVSGTDVYHELNGNIIRHRFGGRTNQLTVKLLKSKDSIINRIEKDLQFSQNMSYLDVEEFLKFAGFKSRLKLIKTSSLYYFEDEKTGTHFNIVMYCVKNPTILQSERNFLEIEIEKDNDVSEEEALSLLFKIGKKCNKIFSLESPINKSLFEIYTGERYKILE